MKHRKIRLLTLLGVLALSIAILGIDNVISAPVTPENGAYYPERGDILINELSCNYQAANKIELYNTLDTEVSVTDWKVFEDYRGHIVTINETTPIPAKGYLEINESNSENIYTYGLGAFYTWGSAVWITNSTDFVVDAIAYGSDGGAPTNIFNTDANTSIARVGGYDGSGTNASNWNYDPTATWGAANDAPGTDLGGTSIVINEVDGTLDFVELYNTHTYQSFNLAGWMIGAAGDDLLVLSGTIEAKSYRIFYKADGAALSKNPLSLHSTTDNVYLYNSSGHRVDQMGYNTKIDPLSWNRLPDGNSSQGFTNDGWNNITSGFSALAPSPGAANADKPYTTVVDVILNDTVITTGEVVKVDVKVTWSNGTVMDDTSVDVSVEVGGTPTVLAYDAVNQYFNGTVNFTSYTPQADMYGIYHTTELKIIADGGVSGFSNKTTGVFINPGYEADDTVILLDEAHSQLYTWTSGTYPMAPWLTMLMEMGIIDWAMCLDLYDYHIRVNSEILTNIDLYALTGPDSAYGMPKKASNALQASEIDAIIDYVENGGSMWLSEVGAAYSIPAENGIEALTSMWGIEWFRGYYQDPAHSLAQTNYCIVKIAPPVGAVFDDFGAFGAEEFYYNGMVMNQTTQVPGVNVTEAIAPRTGSNWDDYADDDFDANMNPLEDKYSLAYLVENGTGMAYITGSSSNFGHYYDFEDGYESAQFSLNVFCYLLGIDAVQYPKLQLYDMTEVHTVMNNNTAVLFKVKLNSTLTGATLYDVEVTGDLEGDYLEFTDANSDGIYEVTWDVTSLAAGTYKIIVEATARNEEFTSDGADGALFIAAKLEITLVVEKVPTTTTTTTKPSPGFELASLLAVLALVGITTVYTRRRRR
ncbi:MAG: lamin tail domain-containing protein [Candidatus Odinarchaeota archaeon]